MATPWLTSDDLIAAVKRKISLPISQNGFTEQDILDFLNEEMMISQVPSVLQYHEEYFVTVEEIPIVEGQTRYPIPNRAIGMRLRDVMYKDTSGNLHEMARVNADDKGFFQRNFGNDLYLTKFYLEGNDVVLTPLNVTNPNGSMMLYFFIRPNQLVLNERAATCEGFSQDITIVNASLVAGDTITIDGEVFTAVASSPGTDEFVIGASSAATATNLVAAINTNGVATATNQSPATAIVTVSYSDVTMEFETDNDSAFVIDTDIGIVVDEVPSNITNSSVIDFLQKLPGHRIQAYDITLGSSAISGTTIKVDFDDVPSTFVVGDYICSQNEAIIPYLPPDLHTGLAERTSARILAAMGDQQGLMAVNQKISEIELRQGNLLDNRVDGAPQKVFNKNSLLRIGKIGRRWGY